MLPGIPIAILRLREPYVFEELKFKILSCLRIKPKSTKRLKYSKESLDTFLNSTMNVNYVSTILIGITNKMQ